MAEDLDDDLNEEEEPVEGAEDGEEEVSRSGGKKKLLMILLPILLVVGGAAGLYFSGFADSLFGGAEKEEKVVEEEVVTEDLDLKVDEAVFYDLPEMLVNLSTGTRKQAYLKIVVSLELDNPTDVPKVEAVLPRIVDNFQVYLRELRTSDLEGASGMYRLREELLTRVNRAIRPAEVKDVLFKEMLVQ